MTIEIRPGTSADLFGAFIVFRLALHRLNQSLELASPEDKPGPESFPAHFEIFRTYTEHLAQTADQFWVAEDEGEFNEFFVTIPVINTAAVEYVLKRGCQTTPFVEHFMSDQPLGQYENYIFMDPPFIT